ncbi:MAG: hypothetical protein K1X57_13010 [Gemmataceae bacterium]|nr:hypothetical protein [Gemmataceae bacterium]
MIHDFGHWIVDHLTIPGLPTWLSLIVISVAMAAASLGLTILALVRIPEDYFLGPHPPHQSDRRHIILHVAELCVRNVIGWLLIALGIVLSFPGVPGQGLLTILLGIMLIDFPGKRRLEQRFVAWPRVFHSVNLLRKKFGRPPLRIDDPPSA